MTANSEERTSTIKYDFAVPRSSSNSLNLTLETGRSIILIGANGCGKTRLGIHIENMLHAYPVHRIAAQKSLSLNDSINIISLERADHSLRIGYPEVGQGNKGSHRWGSKPATHFLSDFDALLQTLFAGHNRVASDHLKERKIKADIPVPITKLEELKSIWDGLLPHRTLQIREASIQVLPQPSNGSTPYPGSEMSDGERAIFYFLGQGLVAAANGVIIIDEPEAHIHKAILGSLWDAIEKARPDCGFIYITHDLDFAVTRNASAKYFIRSFSYQETQWEIEALPQETGLPEYVVAELVGSRKPVLFVEGGRGSLDLTIYRHQYSNFTVVPIGSCDAVIHSVTSYKTSPTLHRLGVRGLVDADHRDPSELVRLLSLDVHALSVAEIENVLLLPEVFIALANALHADSSKASSTLKSMVLDEALRNIDIVSSRFTIRQLDRRLKAVEVKAKDLATLQFEYNREISAIDPANIFSEFKAELQKCIAASDIPAVLKLYDNKGLLAKAASIVGLKDRNQLMEKVSRLLGASEGKKLSDELKKVLPIIQV